MSNPFNPTVATILAHKNQKNEVGFKDHLINLIAECCGTSRSGLIEEYGLESVVPGICTRKDCLTVHDSCEPDARDNTCEECGHDSVRSFLDIMGVI